MVFHLLSAGEVPKDAGFRVGIVEGVADVDDGVVVGVESGAKSVDLLGYGAYCAWWYLDAGFDKDAFWVAKRVLHVDYEESWGRGEGEGVLVGRHVWMFSS